MANVQIQVTEQRVIVEDISPTESTVTIETSVQTIETAVIGPQGIQGQIGPQGIQGIQGTPGAATGSYTHTQGVASAIWTIPHGLGFRPNIFARDSSNRQVWGQRDDPDVNTVVLTFSGAISGDATAS